jgi:hypothetical protein
MAFFSALRRYAMIANPPINFRLSIPFGLMRQYEFENAMMLMRSPMSRLFKNAHHQIK